MVQVVPEETSRKSAHHHHHHHRKSYKSMAVSRPKFSVSAVPTSTPSDSDASGSHHHESSHSRGLEAPSLPTNVESESSVQDDGKPIPPVNMGHHFRGSNDARTRDLHVGVNLLHVENHLTTSFAWLQTEPVVFLNNFFDITDEYEEHHIMGNRYALLDSKGQVRFFVYLKVPMCSRFICFAKNTFIAEVYGADDGVHIFDVIGPTTFLHINLSATSLVLPNGDIFGTISNSYKVCCKADYFVYNANGDSIFKARGPRVCPHINEDFKISLAKTKERVGLISRTWKSTSHRYYGFLDVDTTGFSITPTIDPRQKALLVGLIILIEFQWYNRSTRFTGVVVPAGILIVIVIFLMLWFPSLYFHNYMGSKAPKVPQE